MAEEQEKTTTTIHPFSRIDVWTPRLKRGPEKLFSGVDELFDAATQYFTHYSDSPVKEHVLFHYKGEVIDAYQKKTRPFTIGGLCAYIGISRSTYEKYRTERGAEFAEAMAMIDNVIETQKLEGAMMNIFNGNVVSRHLNLAERHELSGPDGQPIQTISTEMTHKEAAEAYAATLHNK